MRLLSLKLLAGLAGLAGGQLAGAAEWFVAPQGSDAASGSIDSPFASVQRAQQSAVPGDTVFIRGGTYRVTESQIAERKQIWAYVIRLERSGLPGKRINYWAYQDEQPLFDFSAVKPQGLRVHAFEVSGSWVHIRGLEVVGVQVTERGHTQSICFSNNGSHNIFERLSMHDGQAIGIYSVRGSDNLFLNCDAYNNHDFTSEDQKGGNVDGFGCHPVKGAVGNIFRGCRAWFNSDDGFDTIGAAEAVTLENCWAFYNGFSPDFKGLKDGNGFKIGGYGSRKVEQLPRPVPRHVVRFCIAARNRASGFYANHHIGGNDWINNTAWRNANNFNLLGRREDNLTDVPGYGHTLCNNLSYRSGRKEPVVQMDAAQCRLSNNSFDGERQLSDSDFRSLDEKQLLAPRQPDGSLPAVTFLVPVEGAPFSTQGAAAADRR